MERIEKEIFKHFESLSEQIMSKEATDKDIINDLMRSLSNCKSRLNQIEKDSQDAAKIIEIALEGLYAISKFGDSQGIARKTLDQINNIRIKK